MRQELSGPLVVALKAWLEQLTRISANATIADEIGYGLLHDGRIKLDTNIVEARASVPSWPIARRGSAERGPGTESYPE